MTSILDRDQQEFRAAVAAVLDARADSSRVREVQDARAGHDPTLWAALVDLGVPAVLVPEAHGGLGLGVTEASLVLEEVGRRIAPAPYLSLAIATSALLDAGGGPLAPDLLARIAAGEALVTCAFPEDSGTWIPDGVRTVAVPAEGGSGAAGWRVSGTKSFVLDGEAADHVLVLAATPEGHGLFLVDGTAPGLTRTPLDVLDRSMSAARVEFAEAPAHLLTDAEAHVARVDALASVFVAAHLYGGFSAALDVAVQYAKDRYQFGRPIGSFEGVKYPLADLATEQELALSLLRRATWTADHPSAEAPAGDDAGAGTDDLAVDAHTALVKMQGIALEGAIRMVTTLGGIGFTWEHDAHLYQKQAATVRLLLGTPGERTRRLADVLGI
ncbi:acyl-CoA dehydrogenase family protein [Brevibacterium litoralis]|uniref:acyl-CoA dehydrogenase family protein n=1 Tax=Brevibacterium litoralis TaxID=3138935 RepID=UPI0032EDBB43